MPKDLLVKESRALIGLSFVVAFRMFGLFLAIPIIAVYASNMQGSTPIAIGLALGIYGLTQACLQIPFGFLSDIYGRKKVIASGLVIFALGSLLAAMAKTIDILILGRALQGSGAVSAAVMALAADLTREKERTKAMAILGMTIGGSFLLAFVCAPILQILLGMRGIFLIAVALSIIAILILYLFVPNPNIAVPREKIGISLATFKQLITEPRLLILNFSVFNLHLLLAMLFVAMPLILKRIFFFSAIDQVWLYVPTLLGSFLFAIPLLIFSERKQKVINNLFISIAIIFISLIVLSTATRKISSLYIGLFTFFFAFNMLEALLPSLVSKMAPKSLRGSALGLYASCQFLGVFIGGGLGGICLQYLEVYDVFLSAAIVALLWLVIMCLCNRKLSNFI